MVRRPPSPRPTFLSRPWGTASYLIAAVCAGACASEQPEPERPSAELSSFSERDSAEVAIVETLRPPRQLAWEIEPAPEVDLGDGSDPNAEFHQVVGVRGLPDGGFLVVDGGSKEVRFFDHNGRFSHKVGRDGAGPGEFRDPELVRAVGADSLLLWDRNLRRLQSFSVDGHQARTIALNGWPPRAGGRCPLGATAERLLVELREGIGLADFRKPGAREDQVQFVWLDPATGETSTIASFSFVREFTTVTRGRPPSLELIPFTVRPSATVGGNVALVTDGITPELREYGLDGRLRRVIRVDEPKRVVQPSDIRAHLEASFPPEFRDEAAARYSSMPIPSTQPVFQALAVDQSGWIWAETYQWDASETGEWVVFSPDGEAKGRIRMPQGLEVGWVGSEYILGVWRDSLGIERVRRHRLRRQ